MSDTYGTSYKKVNVLGPFDDYGYGQYRRATRYGTGMLYWIISNFHGMNISQIAVWKGVSHF